MIAMDWPDIPFQRWQLSGQSLHMWTQIVGKFRLAQTPWINHSWQATFYVNARGLTTSLIPGANASYEATFDFIDHKLLVYSSLGGQRAMTLGPMSVSSFHEKFLKILKDLGAPTDLHDRPNEVEDPVAFAKQTEAGFYDPDAVQDFWRALLAIDAVFKKFRTGFLGKVSPVHFFWGSFDLAITRFSGRLAPVHPGGVPALPDSVTREAYSHEVSSAGFWPGGGAVDEPCFYSYAYPTPENFRNWKLTVEGASFHEALGEFILPYDEVRKSKNPEQTLLRFLHETYAAAAELAGWDRPSLDSPLGVAKIPRKITAEELN